MVLILASMTVDIAECFNTEYQADHKTAEIQWGHKTKERQQANYRVEKRKVQYVNKLPRRDSIEIFLCACGPLTFQFFTFFVYFLASSPLLF